MDFGGGAWLDSIDYPDADVTIYDVAWRDIDFPFWTIKTISRETSGSGC